MKSGEQPLSKWSGRKIKAMLWGSAALLWAGYNKETVADYAPHSVLGFEYLNSARHPLPAIAATVFTRLMVHAAHAEASHPLRWIPPARRISERIGNLAINHERISSLVIGFIPSVGCELFQYNQGKPIGGADLAVAALSGAAAVSCSISRVEAPSLPTSALPEPEPAI